MGKKAKVNAPSSDEESQNEQKDEQKKQKKVAKVDLDSQSSENCVKAEPVKQWTPRQLFCSGLPYDTTEEELRSFFGPNHVLTIG